MELAEVAARAAGENFPVGSILFPRALRPHVRALYCYARLVDELGDAYDGDRLAALDELEAQVGADVRRRAVVARAPERAADRARVRSAARAVPAPDRGEPDGPARHRVRDVGRPEALLRALGRPVRPARARRAAAARRRRARRRERLRLHRAAARQLPAGRAARPRARARLSAGGGSRALRRSALDRPSDELRALLRFEAERAAALLRAGDVLRARIGGRLGRAVGLFARGGLAALEALESANWDVFTQRPKPSRARLAREAALVLVR